MDIVTLKTKTRKSKVEYGCTADNTVQSCLDLKDYGSIAYVYFNVSWITFVDDILDEAHIGERYRIQKPGRDEDMYKRWKCGRVLASTQGDRIKANAILKSNRRHGARKMLKQAELSAHRSKLQLMFANHGHIKFDY